VSAFVSTPESPRWSMLLGVLLVVAGLLAIVLPFLAAVTTSLLLGWLLLMGSIFHFGYAWSQRGARAVIWQVLLGIIYLAASLSLLYAPVAGVLTLTLVLVAYLAVEGIVEMAVFIRLRSLPGAIWFFVDGVVSLLIAALIFAHWPSSSIWALGTLVGISLIFSGMARLMNPVSSRRLLPMADRHDIDRHDAAA
jgi:uncharacterized membrane protein HdeD (DUF308 family)